MHRRPWVHAIQWCSTHIQPDFIWIRGPYWQGPFLSNIKYIYFFLPLWIDKYGQLQYALKKGGVIVVDLLLPQNIVIYCIFSLTLQNSSVQTESNLKLKVFRCTKKCQVSSFVVLSISNHTPEIEECGRQFLKALLKHSHCCNPQSLYFPQTPAPYPRVACLLVEAEWLTR